MKNRLDPDQLVPSEISLSGFILFSNDTLEIVMHIVHLLDNKVISKFDSLKNSLDPEQQDSPEFNLSDFTLF